MVLNGARVNAVVQELRGEKIDIINWDENPALLIENALSPAKVISVMADPEEKVANVIVPDYQLSLAIGKEGQNARLAARLTGYKIDIKSEDTGNRGRRSSGKLYGTDGSDGKKKAIPAITMKNMKTELTTNMETTVMTSLTDMKKAMMITARKNRRRSNSSRRINNRI